MQTNTTKPCSRKRFQLRAMATRDDTFPSKGETVTATCLALSTRRSHEPSFLPDSGQERPPPARLGSAPHLPRSGFAHPPPLFILHRDFSSGLSQTAFIVTQSALKLRITSITMSLALFQPDVKRFGICSLVLLPMPLKSGCHPPIPWEHPPAVHRNSHHRTQRTPCSPRFTRPLCSISCHRPHLPPFNNSVLCPLSSVLLVSLTGIFPNSFFGDWSPATAWRCPETPIPQPRPWPEPRGWRAVALSHPSVLHRHCHCPRGWDTVRPESSAQGCSLSSPPQIPPKLVASFSQHPL